MLIKPELLEAANIDVATNLTKHILASVMQHVSSKRIVAVRISRAYAAIPCIENSGIFTYN